jgi:hypothetical protein
MMTYIIGLGTPNDPAALKLETRGRRFIRNVMRLEVQPDLMRERIRIIRNGFHSVVPVSASVVYNCYGLTFAARRCAIVDEEDVQAILDDDGYRKLPWDPAAWLAGDVVVYRKNSGELAHAAVVARKTEDITTGEIKVEVLSAWGESGEYLHLIDVVSPLLGRPSEVISQRFLV